MVEALILSVLIGGRSELASQSAYSNSYHTKGSAKPTLLYVTLSSYYGTVTVSSLNVTAPFRANALPFIITAGVPPPALMLMVVRATMVP